MDLSSFKLVWWAPYDTCVQWVTAVLGYPRSLISIYQSKACMRLPITIVSYQQQPCFQLAPFRRYGEFKAEIPSFFYSFSLNAFAGVNRLKFLGESYLAKTRVLELSINADSMIWACVILIQLQYQRHGLAVKTDRRTNTSYVDNDYIVLCYFVIDTNWHYHGYFHSLLFKTVNM